jgi:hypothetical protein
LRLANYLLIHLDKPTNPLRHLMLFLEIFLEQHLSQFKPLFHIRHILHESVPVHVHDSRYVSQFQAPGALPLALIIRPFGAILIQKGAPPLALDSE